MAEISTTPFLARFGSRLVDITVMVLIFAAALALFVRTLLPTVGISDTAEFQYVAPTLGVAHPTGYPLYVFIGKLFTFLPFGNEAYRVNLLSAVSSAGAAALLYLMARLAGAWVPTAVLGAVAFTVTPALWSWATIAEVYGLHVFFFGLVTVLFFLWSIGRVSLTLVLFVLGLSFGNHRGMLLVLPAFGLLWLLVRKPKPGDLLSWKAVRSSVPGALAFLLPWTVYLYIPIRGIPGKQGFWETLDYGASGSALWIPMQIMLRDPVTSAIHYFSTMIPDQFGPLTPLAYLGLVMLIVGFPRSALLPARRTAIVLLVAWVGILAFHLRLYSGDITGFMLPTFWMLGVAMAIGAEGLVAAMSRLLGSAAGRFALRPALTLIAAGAALWLGPISLARANFGAMDLSSHRLYEQRANDILESLDPNGVLVLNDDWLQIWQLKYQRYIANVRPDTEVVEGGAEFILRSMLEIGRPGYSMAYVPSLAKEGRLIPVLSLWRALEKPIEYRVKGTADIVFDNRVTLSGWAAPDPTLTPGGVLPIMLQWDVVADIDEDLVVFVHLLDSEGKSPAGWDAQPLHAENQTSYWRRGQRHDDPHGFIVPNNLPPGRYSVEVGLYPEGSTARLPSVAPDGSRGDRAIIGPFRIAATPVTTTPKQPLVIGFGGLATLYGVDLAAEAGRTGLPVTLFWRADGRTDEDFTVTVQLLDSSGRLVAQRDSQPAEGKYPTSIWRPGEQLVDRHLVPTDRLAPGSYRLVVAMYGRDGRRLTTAGGDVADLGLVQIR